MRLPAITPRSIQVENSRAQHERWFQAFLDGQRIVYPTTPAEYKADRNALVMNGHAFWRDRGFMVRSAVSQDHATVTVWLERRQSVQEAA